MPRGFDSCAVLTRAPSSPAEMASLPTAHARCDPSAADGAGALVEYAA